MGIGVLADAFNEDAFNEFFATRMRANPLIDYVNLFSEERTLSTIGNFVNYEFYHVCPLRGWQQPSGQCRLQCAATLSSYMQSINFSISSCTS